MRTVTAWERSRPRIATFMKQVQGPTPLTRRQFATLASRSAPIQATWRMRPKDAFFMGGFAGAVARPRGHALLPLNSPASQPRARGKSADGKAGVRVLARPGERHHPERSLSARGCLASADARDRAPSVQHRRLRGPERRPRQLLAAEHQARPRWHRELLAEQR